MRGRWTHLDVAETGGGDLEDVDDEADLERTFDDGGSRVPQEETETDVTGTEETATDDQVSDAAPVIERG